jgi:5-(carboxyamino)imidazole ribonucleotide synthase
MCAGPAAELGVTLSVFAEADDASAALVVPSSPVGDHTEADAVHAFAQHCDVVTFDHEHVPAHVLDLLVAEGVELPPRPEALRFAQDKLAMRERLTELGVPCPRWARADTAAEVTAFGDAVGWPVVAKTPRGGYDGKGVTLAADAGELTDWLERAASEGTGLLLEERVPFVRELAVLLARSPSGQAAAWPVVETVQADGQCVQVLAPAPGLDPGVAVQAQEMALRIATELEVTGLLAVELFEADDGGLLVNELAMRPHNSGHWTIEGSRTSQFEQHLRAVLDYPLGTTELTAPAVVMANVLGAAEAPVMGLDERVHHVFARFPDVRVHLYGKAERPARKVGHVTALGTDAAEVRRRAALAAHWLSTAEWADGWSIHLGAAVRDSVPKQVEHA